ncbi:TPA: hypothetical protein ACFNMZ_001503 [Neisseria polysaccharea]
MAAIDQKTGRLTAGVSDGISGEIAGRKRQLAVLSVFGVIPSITKSIATQCGYSKTSE